MRSTVSTVMQLSRTVTGLDATRVATRDLATALKKSSRQEARRVIGMINSLLEGRSRRSEKERIAAAKLLVAFLPESLNAIGDWLQREDDRWCFELHFSLFCFVDDALHLTVSARILHELQSMVASYLASANRDTARAAWMAAHLLADHWPGKQSLDALITAATEAKHVAARSAAICGLGERLSADGSTEVRQIAKTLKDIGNNDQSAMLRRQAARLLLKSTGS